MKQYLTPDQTAKLIGLGFERPKSYTNETSFLGCGYTYSIGELIEIIDVAVALEIDNIGGSWMVATTIFDFTGANLIDCLFDACVKFKEEGVI